MSIAVSLNNLGKIAREQGDPRAARALHAESLSIRRELGDKGGFPWSLEAFARLSAPVHPGRAARLWGAAESLREALGLPLPPNEREEYDRHRAVVREALGEEAFAGVWAEGRAMTPEQAAVYALRDDEEPGPPLRGGAPAAAAPAPPLPAGTVTFLLTDIEGSTSLWEQVGEAFRAALESHHVLLRRLFRQHGGCEVKEIGDAFLVAFDRAGDALACAVAGQRSLAGQPWPEEVGPLRVRMALHTGDVAPEAGDYHGSVLNCAQRVLVAGHGGQILCSEATAGLLRRGLEAGVRLTDLGVYRLRDVALPERLFQVEYPQMPRREFPRLKAEAGYASHLPLPLTRFFGREEEVAVLGKLLLAPEGRLVTLKGQGGSGKTRLALEVARRLVGEWQGAVWFVPLADLTDAQRLPEALRDALRLPRSPEEEPLEQVVAALSRQPTLLVLDNFEHLLDEGMPLVQTLLERVPALTLLVTSRQRLNLAGEREFLIPPLPTPEPTQNPEQLLQCESVQLFLDRAQAVRPDFQVTARNAAAVAGLCQQLEGIPLALELAAARAPVLTPAQMLQHLSDRFGFLVGRPRDVAERHRTLRAALEWSYQSLPESQQRLLTRLSVFRGGWTLEAAEAVCSGEAVLGTSRLALGGSSPSAKRQAPSAGFFDALTELQDASLVIAEDAGEALRFRMLETVREYGEERLAEWGEAEAVRERHRDWYLGLAERAEREFDGPASVRWLDHLENERENLRAALAWCRAEENGIEAGLRLAGALGRFWEVRGYLSEGRSCLADALGRHGADGHAQARAKALISAGVLAHGQTDYRSARAQFEESLAVYQQLGDKGSIASALNRLGNLTEEQGDYAEARLFHEESLSIRRELGDKAGIALSLNCLGDMAQVQGDYESAKARYEESLTVSRELGDKRGWYSSRHLLGVVAEHEGDFALARSIYEECLPVWRGLRFQVQIAWTLHGIGYVAYRQGDFPAARSRLAGSLTLFREMEYTGGLVRTLERLGGLAVARGQMQRAGRLLAAGASQRAATGARAALATPQEYERDVAAVHAGLDAEAFTAAWAEGEAMTLQQAIEYALEDDEEPGPPLRRGAAAVGTPPRPLLATKVVLPVLSPSLLPRPQLTARLNPATPARLALLVAPAGSGKSSLVSQWCQQQPEGSVAWLSLDTEDSDPARFLLYLCTALERVAPQAAAPVRALLQAAQRPSLEYALTLLLNELTVLEQPVTLVLDDYHAIDATAVHDMVTFLVEHLPPTLFLILTTRSDPPLPLPRLRLRGQLIEIRAEDLSFTPEEAQRFLNERMGLTLPPELVDRLAERTEGWIAGLQLAALSLQGEADAAGFMEAFSGSDRYLVDYLSEEVLRRQPPEVQAFLGKTAFLQRLCASLCEAVTGEPGGQAMLERLADANLFLIPLDRERRWYRYHQLFADVLRARLLPEQGEPLSVLHERAAAWYEAEGMTGEAIEHALLGGQFERAARLIEQLYESVWETDLGRLEQWLQALPPALIRTRPNLAVVLASLHNYHFRVAEAEQVLNDCRFEPQDDTPATRDLQGWLLMSRGWAARLQGDKERAARLSLQALDVLPAGSRIFRSYAWFNLATLQADRGELAAGAAFADAVQEAQKGVHAVLRVRASYGLGQLRETQGELREAARLYHEAMEYAREQHIGHTPAAALLAAGLGRISYQRNDLPAAAASLAEGLKHVDSAFAETNPIYAVPCLFELLRLQRAWRVTTAADALFERLAEIAEAMPVPCLDPVLAVLRVRKPDAPAEVTAAWLMACEARTAGGALPSVPIPEVRVPDIRALEIATWTQLRLAGCPVGDETAVVARLERFLAAMVEQGRHGSVLEVRVLLATLQWEGGQREPAVAILEPALTLAEREGYVRVFVEAGPALAPVLRLAAAQGIAPEYVGKLLTALGEREHTAGVPPASRSPALIEPLSDREVEVLRLLAAGLPNKEIAAQLYLAVGTVKRHVFNLYGKLGAKSRMSAVARARELGLL